MMSSKEDKLGILEQRVASLEAKIIGDKKDEPVKAPTFQKLNGCSSGGVIALHGWGVAKTKPSIYITDALLALHNKLQSLVTGREKITSTFAKLDELEKYLDPVYTDDLMLTDGAKMHLVFSVEDKIREAVDSLQTIKDLEQYMNSEHIKATPSFIPKLQKIHKAELELAGNVCAFDDETKRLADEYNTLIESISQQFVLWDSMLSQLEEERNAGVGLSP